MSPFEGVSNTQEQPSQPLRGDIAVIELGDAHVECIFSQLLFLRRGGYRTHLLCSEQLRGHVSAFAPVDHLAFFHPGDDFAEHWKCVFAVRHYLKAHNIGTVVFNTAGGNHTRDICAVAPLHTMLAGVIHHTHKLRGSFTQFLISLRMRRAFVLNDYLLDGIPAGYRTHIESIYLIFREPVEEEPVIKNPGELWIAVPGVVDFRRRDYEGLIDELKTRGPLDASVRFILLGECNRHHGDGHTLRELIAEAGLDRFVVLFDSVVKQRTFFSYLMQCDALLPLIHPATHFFGFYREHQISGTYNLAFGFAKPLLLHDALRGPEDFEVSAFFYGKGALVALLNGLTVHREERQAVEDRIRSCAKFSFERQCRTYLQLLER